MSFSIENDTTGWGQAFAAPSGFLPSSGSIRTRQRRSPEHLRALADFLTIHYTDTRLDNRPITGTIHRYRLDCVDGTVKATTSIFNRKFGEGTITWVRK